MTNRTKNALYSLLDLIDSIGTISFVKLDVENVNLIKKEILTIINENNINNSNTKLLNATNTELLGILPTLLLDESKFPTTKDIITFAEKCLMVEIKSYWLKRSRAELTGIIISEVSKQNANQFNRFLNAWDSFNRKSESEKNMMYNNVKDTDFVNIWLNFFSNYKENN